MARNSAIVRPRKVDDIANCRAIDIGIIDLAECQLAGPNYCSYALPFGYCFLCQHPRLGEIIKNTKKINAAVAEVQ